VGSYAAILKMLDQQQVDAGIVSRLYGHYYENDYDIYKSSINFRPTSLRFATIKGRFPEVLHKIDEHLHLLKQNRNSYYYRSIDFWVEGARKISFPKWLRPIWIIAGVGAIIIIILVGNFILRREVRIRTEALKETIIAKERIESELRIAHDLQMDLVPSHFPAFPDRSEIDIYAKLEPAREVGGDFYDFFFVDEDHLCFGIGDVSGKGVPAALFMSMAKTMIKSFGKITHKTHMILEGVNLEISQDNDSCTFVTVFLCVLNTKTGELCYTNAGHNPPVLLKNKEKPQFLTESGCPAIGIDEEAEYTSTTICLKPDDVLCLYTDGVTEAFNQDGDMYSDERLLQTVWDNRNGTLTDLVEGISRDVHSFSEGVVQSDDITVLALQYLLS
ncbi:MAG: SpoIIE family protein phosphatase, partial [Deltaproteobacteria bacterium]|nr:SpoIIE family protein phosphatase [Deltaproteobacteria bacterium]